MRVTVLGRRPKVITLNDVSFPDCSDDRVSRGEGIFFRVVPPGEQERPTTFRVYMLPISRLLDTVTNPKDPSVMVANLSCNTFDSMPLSTEVEMLEVEMTVRPYA